MNSDMSQRRGRQPRRNSLCSCGSGKKWKYCHRVKDSNTSQSETSNRLLIDPMASMLENMVGPRLLDVRREAAFAWCSTLDTWVISEERLGGYDTQRLERLVQQA